MLTLLLTADQSSGQVKIMPLGNSITRGVRGPSTDDAGFRNDLAALLTAEGVVFDFVGSLANGVGFDSDHEGHDGLRAEQLRDSVTTYLTQNPPEVILLHAGTNDISNDQSVASTATEIGELLDAIHGFDPAIKTIISSVLPRADDKDSQVSQLNPEIYALFRARRDAGQNVFYAGLNEIMKTNPTWDEDFFEKSDAVHPNDAGHEVIARVFLNKLMTVLSIGADISVADNFERSTLGITWDADPELVINEGDLVNTAADGSSRFEFMATYKEIINPKSVGLRWSSNADADGIGRAGVVLLLDSDSRNASGFLAWITPDDNRIRLWTIANGIADTDLSDAPSNASAPTPGDIYSVEMAFDGGKTLFSYYVNDEYAGTLSADTPNNDGNFYSGVLMRHQENNDVAEFFADDKSDFTPPARISDLRVAEITTSSIELVWTATGDNGQNGKAKGYDLRLSTSNIANDADFQEATRINIAPPPAEPGTEQRFTIIDLQPLTTYFFALRAIDHADNPSLISNIASGATMEGNIFSDAFERAELGGDWDAAPSLQIAGGELTNTSNDQSVWDLAVLTARSNPVEVAFRWSNNADDEGIDQGGIAVWLDAPNRNANGYLVTRRTLKNEIRLWQITNGGTPDQPIIETPLLNQPQPGDEFRVVLSSDATGNHCTVFINGEEDVTVTDPDFFIDPRSRSEFYCGVMLAGGRQNNVDNFTALLSELPVSVDEPVASVPATFALSQNYPNPFNPQTQIDYVVPTAAHVEVTIFNIMGQRVRTLFDGLQDSGQYTISWDGRGQSGLPLASGTYLLRLRAGDFTQVRRMQLLK